jgi:hypothetical protein
MNQLTSEFKTEEYREKFKSLLKNKRMNGLMMTWMTI